MWSSYHPRIDCFSNGHDILFYSGLVSPLTRMNFNYLQINVTKNQIKNQSSLNQHGKFKPN